MGARVQRLQRGGELTRHERHLASLPAFLDSRTAARASERPTGAAFLDSRHSAAWLGSTVGRYRILERLGRGGMATVYRARDPSIGRDVALKFLHGELARDDSCRRRFLQEARAAGSLSHPNIVIVHDVGELEGRPYIAMEMCQGGTLADELDQRGALPLREAVSIALQMARALDHAHKSGVVHRDLKPANIMRDATTRMFKLADFGIAHLEMGGDAAARTREGDIVGTPQYMSPEQARGEAMDARSDIFSLGILLYQMVAGERPFQSDSAVGVGVRIASEPHAPLDQLRTDVPRSLRRLVDRCLAKRPAERFQGARELVDALVDVRQELDRGGLAFTWDAVLPPSLRPARVATLAAAGLAFIGLVIAGMALSSLALPASEALWVGATPALVMAALSLATLAALSLATLVVLALWARAVTRPARQLARAMAEVAAGRYGVRLGERPGLQRDGDFGQLFAMFDSMASALQQRQQAEAGSMPTVTAMAAVSAHTGGQQRRR